MLISLTARLAAERIHARRGGHGDLIGITVSLHHELPRELGWEIERKTPSIAVPVEVFSLDTKSVRSVRPDYTSSPRRLEATAAYPLFGSLEPFDLATIVQQGKALSFDDDLCFFDVRPG